ncbi:RAD9, HUS1, RAD1-interacting nuclear orphan protein 1 [Brachyhypopomus gauderio]|uniref:RAD9, HUS1, RAD1-interacting nuclear orphan protein 1 n=1 Tax=Brachyhypopomus gauderio TaxID=698409 RepID=UPI00404323C5
MPRSSRKRNLLNSQKSQLLFVEQPRNGPRHDYGPQLRSAINPRSFVPQQSRPAVTVSSWVSPQFETTTVIQGKKGRKKNLLSTNTSSHLSLPAVKKTTACKYPALSFEASKLVPQRCPKTLHNERTTMCGAGTPEIRPARGDHAKALFSDKQDEVSAKTSIPTPSFSTRGEKSGDTAIKFGSSEVLKTPGGFTGRKRRTLGLVHAPCSKGCGTSLTPPQVDTPEMPHGDCSPSPNIFQLLFSINQPKTPPRSQDLDLLVKDTPERDYGLKVTWRRRKTLMKLLRDRGQLLGSEAIITNQWS